MGALLTPKFLWCACDCGTYITLEPYGQIPKGVEPGWKRIESTIWVCAGLIFENLEEAKVTQELVIVIFYDFDIFRIC